MPRKKQKYDESSSETKSCGFSHRMIMSAAGSGNEGAVKLWLMFGKADTSDRSNFTPLMYASNGGYHSMAQLLINRGAKVNKQSKDGRSALHRAARGGYLLTLKVLLKEGAEIDIRDDDDMTPLMFAALAGHEDSVRELLRKGAEVDLYNEDGDNALMAAALSGHEGTIAALLDAKAKVNESGNNTGLTPLMAAAGRAHTGAVMMLLEKGANLLAVDQNGQNAMMHAMEGGGVCEGCYLMLKDMAKNEQNKDDPEHGDDTKKDSSKSKSKR